MVVRASPRNIRFTMNVAMNYRTEYNQLGLMRIQLIGTPELEELEWLYNMKSLELQWVFAQQCL